jgi:hypothetical protein
MIDMGLWNGETSSFVLNPVVQPMARARPKTGGHDADVLRMSADLCRFNNDQKRNTKSSAGLQPFELGRSIDCKSHNPLSGQSSQAIAFGPQ